MTRSTEMGLLATRLNAYAAIHAQMAAVLLGKGQDELREHLHGAANLMAEAAKAIAEQVSAWDAAGAKLAPTKADLQQSAVALIERMCALMVMGEEPISAAVRP